jgi:cytochrome P450
MTTTQASADVEAAIGAYFSASPETMADPYSTWSRIHAEAGPAVRVGNTVFATSWELAEEAVSTLDTFSPASTSALMGDKMKAIRAGFNAGEDKAYEDLDEFESHYIQRNRGEEHRRLRNQAKGAFVPRHVAGLREWLQESVDDSLTRLAAEGGVVDLRPFSFQLPLYVISTMLGVPDGHAQEIHDWSNRLALGLTRASGPIVVDAELTTREFGGFIGEMIDATRAGDMEGGPLLFTLMKSEEEGKISRTELVATIVNSLFAGHETTTSLISIGMLEALREGTQWRLICEDPGLVPNAVEELLRIVTPVQSMPRLVREEMEWAGLELSAGDVVHGVLVAANRDPEVFEEPNRIDIERANAKDHLALGHGPKFCMGAGLARLEGEVVFGTIARRFPEIELAVDEPVEFVGAPTLRRLDRLPVRLGPDHAPPA